MTYGKYYVVMTENFVFDLPANRGENIFLLQHHYYDNRCLECKFVHSQAGRAVRNPVFQIRVIHHDEFPRLGIVCRWSQSRRFQASCDLFFLNRLIGIASVALTVLY